MLIWTACTVNWLGDVCSLPAIEQPIGENLT